MEKDLVLGQTRIPGLPEKEEIRPHFTSKSDFPPGHMSAPLALQVLSPVETVLTLSLTNEVTGSSCHQSLLQPPSPFFASDTLSLVHSICLDSGTRGTNSKS